MEPFFFPLRPFIGRFKILSCKIRNVKKFSRCHKSAMMLIDSLLRREGVKWRFSDYVLLLTCKSTPYCYSKKCSFASITHVGFDFMVQNVEAVIVNFDKILKIMTFSRFSHRDMTITFLLSIYGQNNIWTM